MVGVSRCALSYINNHYLFAYTDPRGVQVLRNEYEPRFDPAATCYAASNSACCAAARRPKCGELLSILLNLLRR